MTEYKGLHFNEETTVIFYEGGAHFKYKDLYRALQNVLKYQLRSSHSLSPSSTIGSKPSRNIKPLIQSLTNQLSEITKDKIKPRNNTTEQPNQINQPAKQNIIYIKENQNEQNIYLPNKKSFNKSNNNKHLKNKNQHLVDTYSQFTRNNNIMQITSKVFRAANNTKNDSDIKNTSQPKKKINNLKKQINTKTTIKKKLLQFPLYGPKKVFKPIKNNFTFLNKTPNKQNTNVTSFLNNTNNNTHQRCITTNTQSDKENSFGFDYNKIFNINQITTTNNNNNIILKPKIHISFVNNIGNVVQRKSKSRNDKTYCNHSINTNSKTIGNVNQTLMNINKSIKQKLIGKLINKNHSTNKSHIFEMNISPNKKQNITNYNNTKSPFILNKKLQMSKPQKNHRFNLDKLCEEFDKILNKSKVSPKKVNNVNRYLKSE